MSSQALNRVSQPATRVMSVRIGGKKPPQLELNSRFEKAFPEQAENIRRFNEEIQSWWRDVSAELTRES